MYYKFDKQLRGCDTKVYIFQHLLPVLGKGLTGDYTDRTYWSISIDVGIVACLCMDVVNKLSELDSTMFLFNLMFFEQTRANRRIE